MEYIVALIIPALAVAVIMIVAKSIASHTFRCRNCSEEFSIRWSEVLFVQHYNDEYMLECPHCKTKGRCVQQPKK